MAPTGTAEINVSGSTVYSSLKLLGQVNEIKKLGSMSRALSRIMKPFSSSYATSIPWSNAVCLTLRALGHQAEVNHEQSFSNMFIYLFEDIPDNCHQSRIARYTLLLQKMLLSKHYQWDQYSLVFSTASFHQYLHVEAPSGASS